MSKQLLVDVRPFEISPTQIHESMTKNGGKLIVKGVLQRAESKNQNGRVYPRDVLLKEVAKYLEEQVTERRALGELDHPESSVEVLSTPAGNILKELFKSGIKLGISSRGLGSVEPVNEKEGEEDTVEVQPDFELIAFDFVSNPSTHGAFMKPVNEGVQKETTKYSKIEQIISDIMRG
jgi:hypothetical protein